MTVLYVLDIPENTSVATVADEDARVTVDRIGPYFAISSAGAIVVDRRSTDCRHAVWYSAVAGVSRDARVTQHDAEALRVEPA